MMLRICAGASVGLFVGLVLGAFARDYIEMRGLIGS